MRFFSALALAAVVAGTVTRKNWALMSQKERDHFTSAVNKLKESGKYDELVRIHSEAYRTPSPWRDEVPNHLYRNGDQKGPAFLPWHRVQLMMYEEALQKVSGDNTLAVPYWDYISDSAMSDPKDSLMWSAAHGIGGTGREDGVVVDGPFAYWPTKYTDLGEKYLSRTLGLHRDAPSLVSDFLAAYEHDIYDVEPWSGSSKVGFRNWIEGFYSSRGAGQGAGEGLGNGLSLHAQAHAWIGFSMINSTSPNDPAFYMVHAFTDAMWWSWQAKQQAAHPETTPFDHFEPKTGGPINHNMHDRMVSLNGATAADVIDYAKLPYQYDTLPVPEGFKLPSGEPLSL
mmetsp:Transcript_21596/g.24015  ORF Transcript_21596/g.24015 Transcript_21596/m.24015 type:complete len:341 (-) Transcript_21596:107-1129(-)|eukprot:CAMPEP_0205821570 /NCGR_PEP_ID=MMETSP0206-20130828/8510_1 /ASSEMBLY_ACC=CAM_ASM_000279 /TAXON_ID=36767 /ORGANISM="Euplotes focardii, Strain TN1" /LENGTH=340 /DNA_ID=CAMNT_0053117141 /DNA_START=31 /DNA_END=1053 /DNA_ORIENTATION=-